MYTLYVSHVSSAHKDANITVHTMSTTGIDAVNVFPLSSDERTGKIRAVSRVLAAMKNIEGERIVVYVNDKELAQAAQDVIRLSDTSPLLDISVWRELMTTVVHKGIRLGRHGISFEGSGGLTDCEQQYAESIAVERA